MGVAAERTASDVSMERLRAAADTDLLADAAPSRYATGWGEKAAAAEAAPPLVMSRLTLRFVQPALERAFAREWDGMRAKTHDRQGAAVYLAMVVGGGLLLAAGRAWFDPLLGDGCDAAIVWSVLMPLSQLLLLAAAPARWYRSHRWAPGAGHSPPW
jgi:hypothetical protein